MEKKGKELDLTSPVGPKRGGTSGHDSGEKKFLGVHFVCCDVYSRIYLKHDKSAYVGHCPRCVKRVQFQVGSGGSDSRFFAVS